VARNNEDFRPLREFPELMEFFPELSVKTQAVIAETQIPIDEKAEAEPAKAPPAPEPAPAKREPEPKAYHIKFNGTREFGPVRKSTVLDLIECKFLSGKDLISQDRKIWSLLREVEEFQKLVPPEPEEEVVELVETVEEQTKIGET